MLPADFLMMPSNIIYNSSENATTGPRVMRVRRQRNLLFELPTKLDHLTTKSKPV